MMTFCSIESPVHQFAPTYREINNNLTEYHQLKPNIVKWTTVEHLDYQKKDKRNTGIAKEARNQMLNLIKLIDSNCLSTTFQDLREGVK